MSIQRACDKCGMYRQRLDGSTAVTRYTLRIDVVEYREGGQRFGRTQRSAGSIDLCDECWTNVAKPRMNARKGHPKKVAA